MTPTRPDPDARTRGATFAFAALALLGAATLGVLFARWTSTSGWSFPYFVLLGFVLVYLPGRLALSAMRIAPSPLEHLTLSIASGIALSGAIYWCCGRADARGLFWAWPAIVLLASSHPRLRPGFPGGGRHGVRYAHSLLLVALAMAIAPLTASPLYFQNLSRRAGGELAFYPFADIVLHVAVASELTHSIPPQYPYLPGHPLAYHYGMDLLAAMFASSGLAVQDLTVRYLPVLFLALTISGAFCLARRLRCSEPVAVLAALLVVLGEDLSFIPGLLLGSSQVWSVHFLGMPSVVSLYLLNPMLPALGLLLAALIGLERFLGTGHKGWLVGAALLAATVVQFKAFAAVHLLLGLVITAAVYGAVFRRWDALAAAAAVALAVAPLLLSEAPSRAAVAIDPWPYLPAAFVRMGLAETPLGRLVLAFYDGDRRVLPALAFCAVALPGHLLLSFGPRLVGLAAWARALARPSVTGAFTFLMAVMVLAGPPLSLVLAVTPAGYPGRQYFNNAVWFFVQSKYLMWFFAVAPLSRLGRPAALATAGLLLASSLPSTVQYLALQAAAPPPLLERPMVETLEFLRRETRPGEICLAREEIAQAILATTRCRAPALGVFAYSALSPEQQDRLQGMRDGFWEAWRRGAVEGAALATLRVDYVIADVSLDGDAIAVDGDPTGHARLDRRFLNGRFAVFKVRAGLPS